MSKNATALAFKAEGNGHFKNKQYAEAIEQYTKAIEADPDTDVTFYSNRSACYAATAKWQEAARALWPSFAEEIGGEEWVTKAGSIIAEATANLSN